MTLFTVGLDVVDDPRARNLVNACATDGNHVYLPSTGAALQSAFPVDCRWDRPAANCRMTKKVPPGSATVFQNDDHGCALYLLERSAHRVQ